MIQWKKVLSALTTTVALSFGASAAAAEVAPYFYTWGGGKITTLSQARTGAGLKSATLAFAISNGSCAVDPAIDNMTTDIRSFVSNGGSVIISFGGANGTYIETACTDENALFTVIDGLIQRTGVQRLDFDVEGSQLSSSGATTRRTHVLARLQAKYPNLYLSFTLPVDPSGLPAAAVSLLKSTVAGGVRINIVNIMTMDYGSGTTNLGNVAVQSAQGTVSQMASIFPGKTTAQLYAMLGITPMIGINDDGTIFSLSNASQVANFAKSYGVGLLAYWAFQRDQSQSTSGTTNLGAFSGVVQNDFQFYQTFNTAAGGATVSTTTTTLPTTTSLPPTPSSCTYPNWVNGKSSVTGNIVKYTANGKLYIATHNNPGYDPTISTWYWSPYTCTGSTTSTTTTLPPTTTTTTVPTSTSWVRCASEGGVCSFSGTRTVRYGANGSYSTRIATSSIACDNATFGDPAIGYSKTCDYSSSTQTTTSTTTTLPPTTSSCTYPNWVNGKSYVTGNIVKYTANGKLYIATHNNPGYDPTISTWYWSPYTCAGSTASTTTTTTVPSTTSPSGQTGTIVKGVYITFYGFDDNDNGAGVYGVSTISDPTIHQVATEDLGTYDRPSTFATDYRIAKAGTKIYIPKLRKYYIMEDTCVECTSDANNGRQRVDLYIGGNTALEGQPLINCENALTASPYTDEIIINPGPGWPVNSGMVYNPNTQVCNTTLFPVP